MERSGFVYANTKFNERTKRWDKTDAIQLRIAVVLITILLWDEDRSDEERMELNQALERLNKIVYGRYPFANITLRGEGLKQVIHTLLRDAFYRVSRLNGFLRQEISHITIHIENTIDRDVEYEPHFELVDRLVEAAETIEHYCVK